MTATKLPFDASIYIAGHYGLAGSAIWRHLSKLGYENLHGWRSSQLDLRDSVKTMDAIQELRPDCVILAAAKVGGIGANDAYPVEFLIDNLKIQNSVMEAAHKSEVPKLIFLGSSCIYPKYAQQPIREDSLLTGELEPTNDAYAVAKIAGIKLVQSYRKQYGHKWISAMPTNLYGPGDNYDLHNSHVLAALIHRFTVAANSVSTSVTLWGSGTPRREFLHSDDLASAILTIIEKYDSPELINIGTGLDITIKELATTIAEMVGYKGQIEWDMTKPDGTPRKLLDVSKLKALGWEPRIDLKQGLQQACAEFAELLRHK
jgi:GDP-L-fucose synthase